MQLSEALDLLRNDRFPPPEPAVWADLGCGSGLFTGALARLLPPGSAIRAVDQTPSALPDAMPPPDIRIDFMQLDFVRDELGLRGLDGILMANSLHYVADKSALLRKLERCMKPQGQFLIVEYDLEKPVQHWVPYPLSFTALKALFGSAGFATVEKLGEKRSSFGRGNLYTALVRR